MKVSTRQHEASPGPPCVSTAQCGFFPFLPPFALASFARLAELLGEVASKPFLRAETAEGATGASGLSRVGVYGGAELDWRRRTRGELHRRREAARGELSWRRRSREAAIQPRAGELGC